jgi:hypothetical protein
MGARLRSKSDMLKPAKPRLPDVKTEQRCRRPSILVIAEDNFLEVIYIELERHCDLLHKYRRISGDEILGLLEGVDAVVLGPLIRESLSKGLREKRPDLLIVKLTATAEHAKVEAGRSAEDKNYLALPFTRLDELGEIIRKK